MYDENTRLQDAAFNAEVSKLQAERDAIETQRRDAENAIYEVSSPSMGSGFVSNPGATTNFIKSSTPTPTGQLKSSIPAAGDSFESFSYKSMLSQMDAIDKEQDPEKRLRSVSLLQGAIEGHIAAAAGKLQTVADGRFGIPDLEASLQENINADRTDPNYHLYLADSPATAQVRNQLLQARTQSRAAAGDMITQSPELAAMQGAMKIFLSKESQIAMKLFGQQQKDKDKTDLAMEKAGVRGIAVGKLFNPGYTDQQAATYAVANSGDKNFQNVVDNIDNPEALKGLSLSGNAQASTALIEMHSKLTAPDGVEGQQIAKRKAAQELKGLDYFTNTPEGRIELLNSYSVDPDIRKKKKEEIDAIILTAPTKDQRELERLLYSDLATKQIAVTNARTFESNIATWSPSVTSAMEKSPILKPIIDSLKPHGSVSLDRLLGSISAMSDKQAKQVALNELLMNVKEAVEKANIGIFGNVGSELLFTGRIQAALAGVRIGGRGTSVLDYLGMGVNVAGEGLDTYLNRPTLEVLALPGAALSADIGAGYFGQVKTRMEQAAASVLGGKK